MFYVVYCPFNDMYVNDEGDVCSYEDAARFDSFSDATIAMSVPGLRVVGPCIEGETP